MRGGIEIHSTSRIPFYLACGVADIDIGLLLPDALGSFPFLLVLLEWTGVGYGAILLFRAFVVECL
jgi:hypothetical protein